MYYTDVYEWMIQEPVKDLGLPFYCWLASKLAQPDN